MDRAELVLEKDRAAWRGAATQLIVRAHESNEQPFYLQLRQMVKTRAALRKVTLYHMQRIYDRNSKGSHYN